MWHSSSVCAVCPAGHNFDSSQARFDGGEYLFGYVESLSLSAVRIAGALSPSLDHHGFEDYNTDECPSDDSNNLFLSGSGPLDSGEG